MLEWTSVYFSREKYKCINKVPRSIQKVLHEGIDYYEKLHKNYTFGVYFLYKIIYTKSILKFCKGTSLFF